MFVSDTHILLSTACVVMEAAPVEVAIGGGTHKTPKYRNICWTLFSPDPPTITTDIMVGQIMRTVVQYYVYQAEICPNTGHLHWQGYMELREQLTRDVIKSKIFANNTIHIEARRGSAQQAHDYCVDEAKRKADTVPIIWGSMKHQGRRRDFEEFITEAVKGTSFRRLLVERPNATAPYMTWATQVYNNYKRLRIPEFRSMFNIVFWGPPGVGKSRRARGLFPPNGDSEGIYSVPSMRNGRIEWNDYDGEEAILIDDFQGYEIEFGELLKLLDGYMYQLRMLYKTAWAAYQTVIFTSNISPDLWYTTGKCGSQIINDVQRRALNRRLNMIMLVDDDDMGNDDVLQVIDG